MGSKTFDKSHKSDIDRITPEVISSYADGNLRPEELKVGTTTINFALGEKDPLLYVDFYHP